MAIRTLHLVMILALSSWTAGQAATPLPLFDAHIHYSHDAWDGLPAPAAVSILRDAGFIRVFVSSSSDEGTQRLYKEAPDLVVPVLRPYRQRGEIGTWFRDDSVVGMIEGLLKKNTYAGIGEFHISGHNADSPVMRQIVLLAKKHRLFLHAHADAEAVERLFAQNPDARILWAHAGFENPAKISEMLEKYPNLRADLAFRSEHARGGKVDPKWRSLFLAFPNRFLVGSDTYTPSRWEVVKENAQWTRRWLKDLPVELGKKIAYENAQALADWALKP